MALRCICAKNWEACPLHDWERATSTHLDVRNMEAKAQREIRRQRRLAHAGRDSQQNRQEF